MKEKNQNQPSPLKENESVGPDDVDILAGSWRGP